MSVFELARTLLYERNQSHLPFVEHGNRGMCCYINRCQWIEEKHQVMTDEVMRQEEELAQKKDQLV